MGDTVEVWFGQQCCAGFERADVRAWLHRPSTIPLLSSTSDAVSICLNGDPGDERVALVMPAIGVWTLSPTTLEALKDRLSRRFLAYVSREMAEGRLQFRVRGSTVTVSITQIPRIDVLDVEWAGTRIGQLDRLDWFTWLRSSENTSRPFHTGHMSWFRKGQEVWVVVGDVAHEVDPAAVADLRFLAAR